MTVTLGLFSTSLVKSRRPLSSRKAVSSAGLPSATVTCFEPDFSATAVESFRAAGYSQVRTFEKALPVEQLHRELAER